MQHLTLRAPVTTAADDIHKYIFVVFLEKTRLDVSSESSARQRIHMKNQALFSSTDKSTKLKCRLLQFLCGALRVNNNYDNCMRQDPRNIGTGKYEQTVKTQIRLLLREQSDQDLHCLPFQLHFGRITTQ